MVTRIACSVLERLWPACPVEKKNLGSTQKHRKELLRNSLDLAAYLRFSRVSPRPRAPNWAGTDLRQLCAPTLRASGCVARLRRAARSIFLSSFQGLETPQMKFEAACPSKIVLVVDHIGLVGVTVGCTSASVASFDVAQRRLALWVAVILADLKLSIIIIHEL